MSRDRDREMLFRLVGDHESWRGDCINLIAAENVMSPQARQFLSCDLAQRYGDYLGRDLHARKYFGNRFVVELEELVVRLAKDLFGVSYVDARPVSGHMAGNSVILGLVKPRDVVLEVGSDGGGHRLASKLGAGTLAQQIDVRYLPFDAEAYNIDLPRGIRLIRETTPRLVILGSSNFLFPHPVREIAEVVQELNGTVLGYDGAHVLGLIAGGRFQDPLGEGADVLFGSTHKTFPGPQGGIILSDLEDLIALVGQVLYPGLVTNHHLARLPSLAMTLLEMLDFGEAYASQVVRNAQRLAKEIHLRGIDVVGARHGYTQSHTVILQTMRFGSSRELGLLLEEAGIIVSPVTLPDTLGGAGLRLGAQEITRRGAAEEDMPHIAELIADVIARRKQPKAVRCLAIEFVRRSRQVAFCYQSSQ